ncbi:MAG: helix-turn-helix domain-containing protein [Bacteroidota bacterium]
MKFSLIHNFIFIGVLFAIVLLWALLSTKKYRNKATVFLCVFLVSLSASNLYYLFADLEGSRLFGSQDMLPMSLTTLIIISAYGYIMLLLGKYNHLVKYKLALILPIILQSVTNATILFGLLSKGWWFEAVSDYILPTLLAQEIAAIVLALLLGLRIMLLLKDLSQSRGTKSLRNIKWAREFFYSCLLIVGVWLVLISLAIVTNSYYSQFFYPLWTVISLSIIWITIRAVQNPERFSQPELVKRSIAAGHDYFSKLELLMSKDKPYKDTELTLKKLATALGLGINKTSSVLSEKGYNFYSYVNFHRVEEVKRLLGDSANSNLTIEAIGEEAGFKSKSSLFDNFKKVTGQTPAEYKSV